MALIQPNGTIQLFNNLRLDSSYKNTYFWDSAGEQASFFASKVVVTYSRQSYTRQTKSIKVQAVADNIYSCNYMRFQNDGFGQKWFYAFITRIDYISNTCAEIFWELDVMQTWFFNFDLNGNFIERIHTRSDDLFEHIEKDISPFSDDYVVEKKSMFTTGNENDTFGEMGTCILVSKDSDGEPIQGGRTLNGIYSYMTPYWVSTNIAGFIEQYLEDLGYFPDNMEYVYSIYHAPYFCLQLLNDGETIPTKNVTFNPSLTVLDSHQVVNKKCLCYPYNYLILSNNQGCENQLRLEDFANASQGQIQFTAKGVCFPTAELMLYPRSHKRVVDDYENGVIINSFPNAIFNVEQYNSYINEHRNSLAISGVATAIGVAQNPVSILNSVGSMANLLDMRYAPPTTKGSLNSDGLTSGLKRYGFTVFQKCLCGEQLRQIDNYFTKYGYAINRVVNDVNRSARSKFTYVKTRNCAIYGNIPSEDSKKIEEIHDRGITYWKSTATIGDFTNNQTTA